MTSRLRSSPGEPAEADQGAGPGGGLELVRRAAQLSVVRPQSSVLQSLSCDVSLQVRRPVPGGDAASELRSALLPAAQICRSVTPCVCVCV